MVAQNRYLLVSAALLGFILSRRGHEEQCVSHRDKEHSTIIYESPRPDTPLLRLGWNKQDPRYMATVLMDSTKVVILDIRCASCLLNERLLLCVAPLVLLSKASICMLTEQSCPVHGCRESLVEQNNCT